MFEREERVNGVVGREGVDGTAERGIDDDADGLDGV